MKHRAADGDTLVRIFKEAVRAVRPDRILVEGSVRIESSRRLDAYGRVVVVAMGKAAVPFAVALETLLGDRIDDGIAVLPHGYLGRRPADLDLPVRIRLLESGHPVPDQAGVAASRAVLELSGSAGPRDLVVVCVSGGGSALLPAPPRRIPVRMIGDVTRSLLRSGAPIDEVNTVRRALSGIAGGGLAASAAPAEVLGLVLSDVPGDDPAVVAGGPVSTSPTTGRDAADVLERWGISCPAVILEHLAGRRSPAVTNAVVKVLGTNADLLRAAGRAAEREGFDVRIHPAPLQGHARSVGVDLARRAIEGPPVHILGGETTVRVTGPGIGGRNQELALAAAIELDSIGGPVSILAAGSDGVDGPTSAAGAVCDERSVAFGAEHGMSARECLDRNDSWRWFDRVGGHVVTGPTHTNVMDLAITVRRPSP